MEEYTFTNKVMFGLCEALRRGGEKKRGGGVAIKARLITWLKNILICIYTYIYT